MGIILIGLIVISALYFVRWIVTKFERWTARVGHNPLKTQLILIVKIFVIVTIALVAFGACFAAATFDYGILFK